MKYLFITICLLLTSCASFSYKKVSPQEEALLKPFVPSIYKIIPGTIEYQASDFYHAKFLYGEAYRINEHGYFFMERNETVTFKWASSKDGLPTYVLLPPVIP